MIIYDFIYNLVFTITQSAATGDIIAMVICGALPLLFLVLPFTLVAVWLERKVSAHMQDRLGPMRTGSHGWLQTIADLLKLLQKEDIVATDNDRPLFYLAPILVFSGSYLVFAALPFSSAYIGSNIDLGIIFIIAASGFVVAGIMMAGWSDRKRVV